MTFTLKTLGIALGLFLAMLLLLEVGHRWGLRRREGEPEGGSSGAGAVEGAVFGLLGLLVAFTFSGAASRFDARRNLVVEESNTIGTAYLRLDLLPLEAQPALRQRFREYTEVRLALYRQAGDLGAAAASAQTATRLQSEIWTLGVEACRRSTYPSAPVLLLPALNQMIDITSTRAMAARTHPPAIVFLLLGGLALAGSLLAGFGMAGARRRNWAHRLGFAAMFGITVFVILDLEYPRLGLIRVDGADEVLIDLRKSLG